MNCIYLNNIDDITCELMNLPTKKELLTLILFDLDETEQGKIMLERLISVKDDNLNIRLFQVNISKVPECTSKYNLTAVPTICVFDKNLEISRIEGLCSIELIQENLKTSFNKIRTSDISINVYDHQDFELKLKCFRDSILLVDFYADWCIPCRILGPILEEIVLTADNVQLCKVDVTKLSDLAFDYNVANLPTVIAFHKMEKVHLLEGLKNKEQIEAFINEIKTKIQDLEK